MSKPKPPTSNDELQTIDPQALATVAGGKAREPSGGGGGDSDAIMTALSGILGELSSLASRNQNSGISAQEMMLFMMMMGQHNAAPAATPHMPTNWTWDANGGYWVVK